MNDGSEEEKEIYELTKEDAYKYHLLGPAIGINMVHCVQLGADHEYDFWHRVYGYRIVEDPKTEMISATVKKATGKDTPYIAVCFYERLARQGD